MTVCICFETAGAIIREHVESDVQDNLILGVIIDNGAEAVLAGMGLLKKISQLILLLMKALQ